MSAGFCLSAIFTTGGLLVDRDGDGLPDALRASLATAPQAQQPEHLVMVDLAARLGFESLALQLPLVAQDAGQLADEAIPLFVGRPATLSAACPAGLRAALERLQAGEGLIALSAEEAPALLVGGADAAGLAAATRVASQLPWLQGGHDLGGLLQSLRAACPDVTMDLAVEALLTRRGHVAVAHLRATLAPADLPAAHTALAALPGRDALPCDLAVTLDAGEGSPTTLHIAGPAQYEDQASRPADAAMSEAPPLRTLAGLYGPEGLALDRDGDLLPDSPRSVVVLPDDLTPLEATMATLLGLRLGLETLGVALPLAYAHGSTLPVQPGDVTISVEPLATAVGDLGPGEGELRLLEAGQGSTILRVRGGDAPGRAAALRELAFLDAMDAAAGPTPTLEEWELAVRRLCALVAPGARACAALAAVAELPAAALAPSAEPLRVSATIPALPPDDLVAVREQLRAWVAARAPGTSLDVAVASERAERVICEETHRLAWEVDAAWAHVESEALPALAALPSGQRDWLLDVRLSEPPGRRRQVKHELLDRIRAAGLAAGEEQVRVLPAYWQGRTWLLEEVAPRLRGRDVAIITVRVQRFARDYPCLELPIRWLQDLHPVDELLGAELGLPQQAIRFELVEQANTYEVEARNAAGSTIWRDSFDVIHGQRPYLHGFPEWGTVHPPTGCVRLLVQGAPVVDARVAPDPERAWDLVQASLLPRLRDHVMAMTQGRPRPDLQPFFGSLAVEAWLSEEDSALGLREERVSPLESLHEDLYFMLLDYCSALMGTADEDEPYRPPWVRPRHKDEPRRGARMWTAPGPVLPYIHRADGAGARLRFRLTAPPDRTTALAWTRGAESGVIACQPAPEVNVNIVGLRLFPASRSSEAKRRLLIELGGSPEQQERARRLLAAWAALRGAGAALDVPLASWSCAIAGDAGEEIDVPALPVRSDESGPVGADELPSEESSAPWDRVLGLADVERSLRSLARSPRVRAYQTGRSARGRPLYAVELTAPRQDGLWSRAKLSAWKCTLLLNARHHANETSSTSALLRLAELLAHDAAWSRYLDRVNVVLIPYENADGAALHYTLQQEHPTWMLHAGRYNDAGLEFIAEYSNPLTRHSEALVLPALWRRWAPDITCDDHGFPAHEWVQPFAGHCNPWFRSHWISQGLIYLIVPRIANPRYAQHRRAADVLQRRLVSALSGDPAIRARNSAYADRYRTFLSEWLPDEFPAPFEDDVLTHSGEYDPDDPARGSSLASLPGRYPGVTTASLITEVADETAQGRYMALCAHTHLLANRVMLEYLYDANAPGAVQRDRQSGSGARILLRAVRPRPVVAGPEPSSGGPVVDTP